MDPWVGRPLDDLIFAWGPPAAAQRLADGREIVVFRRATFVDGTQYGCNVTVRADQARRIMSYTVDGNIGGCNGFFRGKRPPS